MSCCRRAQGFDHIDSNTRVLMVKSFDTNLVAGVEITNQPIHIKWMMLDLKYAVIVV